MLGSCSSLASRIRALTIMAVLAAVGCSTSKDGPDSARVQSAPGDVAARTASVSSAPSSPGAPETAAQSPASATAPDQSPEMPEPWASISPEDFRDYVNGLRFSKAGGKTDVDRRCKSSATGCSSAGGKTKVDIDPEQRSAGVGPGSMRANGHVVAVLLNEGPTEAKYSLPRRERVFWLVTRGQGNQPDTARFVWIDSSGKAMEKRVASAYRYIGCQPDQHTGDTTARAACNG